MAEVRLSQCMIVKDEENNIERALTWGKKIAFEQIVVDTGSTDRTVEIAERMGARVYHFDWIDDFAAAKNYAIDQAEGDWILFLDADEYIPAENAEVVPLLAGLIDEQYPAAPCTIQCLKVELDSNGEPTCTDRCERIFSNRGVHYLGSIHEILIADDGSPMNIYNAQGEFCIYHTGYSEGEFAAKKKLERNRRMLFKKIEEDPENRVALFYLGDNYRAEGDWEKALEFYRRSIELTPHTEENQSLLTSAYSECLTILGQTEEPSFLEICQEAVEYDPEFPDFYYTRALWEHRHGNLKKAVDYMDRAVDSAGEYRGIAASFTSSRIKQAIRFVLEDSAACGDAENFIKYSIFSLHDNRYDEEILEKFIRLLSGNPSDDGSGLYELLSQIYHMEEERDRLFVLKGAEKAGNARLAELLKKNCPEQG